MPIAVEIARRDRAGIRAHGIISGKPESAVAAASQQADTAITVGDCQIWYAIAIEVNDSHVVRIGAGREANRALEASIAISQKLTDCAEAVVAYNHIWFTVAVEVAHLDVLRGGNGVRVDQIERAT